MKEIQVKGSDINAVLFVDIDAFFEDSEHLFFSETSHLESLLNRQIMWSEKISVAFPKKLIHTDSFGSKLREWRQKNNVDAQRIADELRLNKETVLRWERGESTPHKSNKEKIIDYMRNLP